MDGVYPDAGRAQLDRERLRNPGQRRLRPHVRTPRRPHPPGGHRVDHHHSPVACCLQRRQGGARHVQRTPVVHLHHRPPPSQVRVLGCGSRGAAGERVVDQDVDPAELALGQLGERDTLRWVGDVGRAPYRSAPDFSDLRRDRTEVIRAARAEDKVSAVGGEQPRDRAAEPRPDARDDRDLSFEQPAHLVPAARFPVRGISREMSRRAGHDGITVPPLTYRVWPVTNEDASETRYMTAYAMSSGSPTRPSGIAAAASAKNCLRSSGVRRPVVIGVMVSPGATVLARMPSGASSTARLLVSATTPPLETAYAP